MAQNWNGQPSDVLVGQRPPGWNGRPTPEVIVVPRGVWNVGADYTVPVDVTLVYDPLGILYIEAGVTLTIYGSVEGPRTQWISGPGTVVFANHPDTIYPEWFGAKFDDTTDDAPAIQAAINAVGDTTQTRRSGPRVLISGPAAIASTIVLQGKSILFEGTGWGLRPTGGIERHDSWLRWIGAAGLPMLQLKDTFGGLHVRRLRLIGDPGAVCSAAISIYQTSGAAGNSHNTLEEILIGQPSGEIIAPATAFTHGIRFEGNTSQNNDSWVLRQVYISGVVKGIRTGSGQHLGHYLERITITNAQVAIELAGGEIIGESVFCSAISDAVVKMVTPDDFSNTTTPQAYFTWLSAESANRLADLQSPGKLQITGGYFQITASLNADGKIIKTSNNHSQQVAIRDYRFSQSATPPTPPFLDLTGAGGGSHKTLIIDNVSGFIFLTGGVGGIDASTIAASDRRTIYYNPANNPIGTAPARFSMQSYSGVGNQFDPDAFDIVGKLNFYAISPSQITTDAHNYDPGAATVIRLSLDAPHNLTGIVASVSRARFLILINTTASTLTILHDNTGSLAPNRIYTPTGASASLAANDTAMLIYDPTTTRWRMLMLS